MTPWAHRENADKKGHHDETSHPLRRPQNHNERNQIGLPAYGIDAVSPPSTGIA
jgi:hypothetical protein